MDTNLGHTGTLKMKIDTWNASPINLRHYRAPFNNRHVIDVSTDRSRSPWRFSVVIVDKKKGGSKQFYVDFRKFSQITKKNCIFFQ